MNQKTLLLIGIIVVMAVPIAVASFHRDFIYINWFISLCYGIELFAFVLLPIRIFLNPKPNFYLAYFSVMFAVFIFELLLRLFGINATYLELRNGFYVSPFTTQENAWYHTRNPKTDHQLKNIEYNFPRHTNSLGLSDIEFNIAKKQNTIRVIGLGDSFTEGDGASQDSTWLKRLAENLKKKHPNTTFDIYNAGICGSDPFFCYKLLEQKLINYKPDIIVLSINNSDIDDYFVRGGMERFLADSTTAYRKHPWYEFPMAISYIQRLILKNILDIDFTMIANKDKSKLTARAQTDILSAIKSTSHLCHKNNCKLIVLFQCMKFEYFDKSYYAIKPIINQAEKDSTISVVNLLDSLLKNKTISDTNIANYYWYIDGHNNAKGYALMGDVVTTTVEKLINDLSLYSTYEQNNYNTK